MKKRGRQTLLTKKLQTAICKILEDANTIVTACHVVGIGEKTYFRWCELHPTFLTATREARARAKMKLVEIIRLAAIKNPLHACWLLERSWPNEYSRVSVERVEQIGEPEKPSVNILYQASKKELKELLNFPVHPNMLEPTADEMPKAFAPDLPPDESEDDSAETISDAPAPKAKNSDAPPPKFVPKFLTGRIPEHWKGKGNGK